MGWNRVTRRLCRNGVLAALIAFVLSIGSMLLFAQHTGTASLGVTVAPAVRLTTNGSTSVSLAIRLATGGTGYLWGNSSTSCTSPIGTAIAYSTSGMYNNIALSSVPFSTSNAYVCAYDPGASPSSAFVTWPHTDASLKFGTQPTSTTSGASIVPAVTVQVLDSNGAIDTSSTASVTVAIGTNPVGGTLGGILTQSAVNGVATFSNLSINKAGTGYTLSATSGSLTAATSNSFTVNAGTATHLGYTTVPSTATAGTAFSVTVQSQDANGNPASPTSNTTITLSKATGGGTLSGTLTGSISTSANSVTISTPVYSAADTMTLTATATAGEASLTPVTSGNIVFSAGALDHFLVEKSGGGAIAAQTAGTTFSLRMTAQDVNNNTVTSFTSTASMTSTGTLTGSPVTSASFVAGVLDPQNVTITNTGSFTMTATASSKTGTSNSFTVNAGIATKLVFTANPTSSTGGVAFGTQPQVTVEDANGNTVTSSAASITLSIASGTPTSGGPGTLTCSTNPLSASSGITTFSGCSINTVGSSYKVNAVATGLTAATSSAFSITAGAAAKFVITGTGTQSAGASQTITITAIDAGGNTATSYTGSHSLTFSGAHTSPNPATNPTVTSSGGTATNFGTATAITFSSGVCSAGGAMKLYDAETASVSGTDGSISSSGAGNLTAVVSAAAASKLIWGVEPPSSVTRDTIISPAMTVWIEDQYGNLTNGTASVTLTLGGVSGNDSVSAGSPVSAVAGTATFSAVQIGGNQAHSSGASLAASGTGLTSATSTTFAIQ
jgi:hypothetical protein